MSLTVMTLDGLRTLLDSKRGDRTWAALARDIGISEGYLSEIRHGTRKPGPRVLTFLGVQRCDYYAQAPKDSA